MPKSTPEDVQLRENLRSIKLWWFFRTLELTFPTPSKTDPFDFLTTLRKKGLKLTAAPEGDIKYLDPIDHKDISDALAKVKHDCRKFEERAWDAPDNVDVWASKEAAVIWKHEVPVCGGDPSNEYRLSVGDLWVKEDDYATVCRRLGMETYHWPRIHWPQQPSDLEERSTTAASDDGLAFEFGFAKATAERLASRPEARAIYENYEKHERDRERIDRIERHIVGSANYQGGYYPIKEAVRLLLPGATAIEPGAPAWDLWARAEKAKSDGWSVRQREQEHGGELVIFVHLGDFIEWAAEWAANNNVKMAQSAIAIAREECKLPDSDDSDSAVAQTNTVIEPSSDDFQGQTDDASGSNEGDDIADLFEPVRVAALEKMFPANGQWTRWAERAKRNGLHSARANRGAFNPYNAARWFLDQGAPGWDWDKCCRVLLKNAPPNKREEIELALTGKID